MSNVPDAVHDFLRARILPASAYIVRGWANLTACPRDAEGAVITLAGAHRRGSTVRSYAMPPDPAVDPGLRLTLSMLTLYDVQVDFCGQDEHAVSSLAARLALLARDAAAVAFFKPYGLSCLHAEGPKALPPLAERPPACYSIILHLSGWTRLAGSTPAFETARVRLENTDVHHPVR